MSNLPSKIAAFPTPTPQISQSLSPEERDQHRSKIGFEVEVVLTGYWQTDMDPKLRAAVLADWADELEDWPLGQVRWALREWRRENPRRKPNQGDILVILKKRRGEEFAARAVALPKPEEPPKERITEDRRKAILAEMGVRDPLAVKTVSGIEAAE